VYRVVGKPAGAVVFILDVLKGYLPPVIAVRLLLDPWWVVAAGLAAFFGHSYSPFLGFKGGKGVATSLGVLLGVAWKVGVTAFVMWVVLVGVTGYVSVASIAAAISLAPLTVVYYRHTPGYYSILAFVSTASAISI